MMCNWSIFFNILLYITYTNGFIPLRINTFRISQIKPLRAMTLFRDDYNASNISSIVPVLHPKPIPIISFDDMFLNLQSIYAVHMSSNKDRIIIEYNNKKGVYYIRTKNELDKTRYILSLIDIETNIISDYSATMDNPNGNLYCSPRLNSTFEEMAQDVINQYTKPDEDDTFDADDFYFD